MGRLTAVTALSGLEGDDFAETRLVVVMRRQIWQHTVASSLIACVCGMRCDVVSVLKCDA